MGFKFNYLLFQEVLPDHQVKKNFFVRVIVDFLPHLPYLSLENYHVLLYFYCPNMTRHAPGLKLYHEKSSKTFFFFSELLMWSIVMLCKSDVSPIKTCHD